LRRRPYECDDDEERFVDELQLCEEAEAEIDEDEVLRQLG
jgi:hypothetical protein